ncbi:hypothetical protein D3C72_1876610 [compost metagenome]
MLETSNSGSGALVLASTASNRGAELGAGAGGGAAAAMTRGLLTSSVQDRGKRACVLRPGWPVDSVSCTLLQSSPLACTTRAWRSSCTWFLTVSSCAR